MNFYLNSHLRKKEFQVVVQPTSRFIVEECVPICFSIYTKSKYFQDFMEEEKITSMINKDNFEQLVEKYTHIYEEYSKKLVHDSIVFVEGDEYNLDTFYLNNDFITAKEIIQCCEKYTEINGKNDFVVYLSKNKLLYKNNEFFNLDLIENNAENNIMEEYIQEKVQNQLNYKDIVSLYVIDKWIEQEKVKYPKTKAKLEDYFIQSDKKGYFIFDSSEDETLTKKAIDELNIVTFLIERYGEKRSRLLIEVYNENPYIRWKW